MKAQLASTDCEPRGFGRDEPEEFGSGFDDHWYSLRAFLHSFFAIYADGNAAPRKHDHPVPGHCVSRRRTDTVRHGGGQALVIGEVMLMPGFIPRSRRPSHASVGEKCRTDRPRASPDSV